MSNIIQINNLNKSFGSVNAVQNLSFRVKKGELFAFLGINGAGKSTTINIMCGQLSKDSGSVFIDKHDLDKDMDYIKRELGVVFQSSALDSALSVYDNLESRAALYGITGMEFKKRLEELAKILDFEKHKMEYLVDIKNVLENNLYNGGRYNIFLVFEPKVRVIMAQGIYDKIINHYVTRYILIPKLEKYLNDRNCATRKGMGTSYAIKLLKKDIESFKKYDKFYFYIFLEDIYY